jgi:hypothetical protein
MVSKPKRREAWQTEADGGRLAASLPQVRMEPHTERHPIAQADMYRATE